jgi:short-subunit dehydrogenase
MASLPVVLTSMRALEKNKSVSIPGFSNKVLHILMKILPRKVGAKVVMRIQKQRF